MTTTPPIERPQPEGVNVPGVVAAAAGVLAVIALSALGAAMAPNRQGAGGESPAAVAAGFAASRDWGDGGSDELARLRAREQSNLEASGWTDDAHSARRIPIEQAMDLVARGVPAGAQKSGEGH